MGATLRSRRGEVIVSEAAAGPRQWQVHRPQPARDVPFVPTDDAVVESMLDLAKVGPEDLLYDLGCGDGRIALAAAQRGARAVGVDIDLQRIRECCWNASKVRLRHRVQFLRQSFFDVDLRQATVVTMYLLRTINIRLRPRLLWELRPGARIVSNYFDMGDWLPDDRLDLGPRTLYLWIVPAWVAGRWHCIINDPRRRYHMILDLKRRYQSVFGAARLRRRDLPVLDGRLVGDRLSFTLPDPRRRGLLHFTCRFDGRSLRGTCQPDASTNAEPLAWGGMRE